MYTKISIDRSNELRRNFLFGSPDLLIEHIIEDSNGITLTELATKFIETSQFYHRSIKRDYPNPVNYRNSQRIVRA